MKKILIISMLIFCDLNFASEEPESGEFGRSQREKIENILGELENVPDYLKRERLQKALDNLNDAVSEHEIYVNIGLDVYDNEDREIIANLRSRLEAKLSELANGNCSRLNRFNRLKRA